jgi:hypothetical protein
MATQLVHECSRVPVDIEEALEYIQQYGYPVKVQARFASGGWARLATNQGELENSFAEASRLSPFGRAALVWER